MKWFLILLVLTGCSMSPIPYNVSSMYKSTHEKLFVQSKLCPGDIVFRQGEALVAGGLINFSALVAQVSDSDFSHAAIVCDVINGEAVIADVSYNGMQRFFFVDWLMDGNKNIVVKRLKPEYTSYIPIVLGKVKDLIKQDPLYAESFKDLDDNKFYCIEVVDYCFRESGLSLADRIRIRDLPNFSDVYLIAGLAELLTNIDLDSKVVIAGNDEIGLFSSPYLETIIDLRN